VSVENVIVWVGLGVGLTLLALIVVHVIDALRGGGDR